MNKETQNINFNEYRDAGFEITINLSRNGYNISVMPEVLYHKLALEEIIRLFDYKEKENNGRKI